MSLIQRLSHGLSVTCGLGLLLLLLPANVAMPEPDDIPSGQIMSAIVNVYVSGAVRKPGVYRFPVGTRTIQAIQRAGGLLPGTPAENIALTQLLRDGQSLHVDAKPTPAPSVPAEAADQGGNERQAGGRSRARQSGGSVAKTFAVVELNTATVDMLDALPGIGRKRAGDIVRYRQQHGSFHNVDQLHNIRGVGPKMIARLRPHLRL